jgi:two-component system alkaline phosphatase synthesis response regulator PhoP
MNLKPKVLIVDDDESITELLQYNLQIQQYDIEIAHNGTEAIEKAKVFLPNIILMDIMMPGVDGVMTCKMMREIETLKKTYIIFLTARSEEYSEVAAFEAGANDYVVKPVKPKALLSRIASFLSHEKKATIVTKSSSIQLLDLVIDKESYSLYKDNQRIDLVRKEFELLYFFCQHPDKIFNRDELLRKVWGSDVCVVSRTVDVHVRKIREKIGEQYIRTVKGIGYKMTSY